MNRYKIIGFMLIFAVMVSFTVATNQKLYSDNWEIIKQDYMQSYINYDITKIDTDIYVLSYKITDEDFFNEMYNFTDVDQSDLDDLKITKELKKLIGEDEKVKKAESFSGYADKYLKETDNKELLKDLKDLLYKAEFPIIGLDNISIIGKIDPINKKSGDVIIKVKKGINKTVLKIGYSTLVLQFSDGDYNKKYELSDNGFLLNEINYLKLSKYSDINSDINSGSIDIEPLKNNYSIYSEFDYFEDSEINRNLWNKSVINNDGDCTSTQSIESDKLKLRTHCVGGSGSHNSNTYIINNNTIDYPIGNLTSNKSFYISLSYTGYCNAPCSGTLAKNYVYIYVTNKTDGLVSLLGKSINCIGNFGSISGSYFVNLIFNESTDNITIYDNNNNLLDLGSGYSINISTLGLGDKYFRFETSGNKQGGLDPCGSTGYITLYIDKMGYNFNITKANNFNASVQNYPNQTTVIIGDEIAFYNSTTLDINKTINITSNLTNSINNGDCDCSGCYIITNDCYIPLIINSSNGGSINVSNISINITYAAANLTLSLYDSQTLSLINHTNITVQLIGDVFQIENQTDNGSITFEFGFSENTEDEILIRAFSTDITDYSIISRVINIEQGTNLSEDIYMVNSSDTDKTKEIIYSILDENKFKLNGALLEIYQQNPATNKLLHITDLYSNPNGEAITTLFLDTIFYSYIVKYNNNVVFQSPNPTSISDSTTLPIILDCVVGVGYTDYFVSINNFNSILNFVRVSNESGYYTLQFNNDDYVNVCLDTYYYINELRTNVSYTCYNDTSKIFSSSTASSTIKTIFYGDIYIDFFDGNGLNKYRSIGYYIGTDGTNSDSGRLLIFIVLIFISGVLFVYVPVVGLIVLGLGTMVLVFTNFTLINPLVGMFIVGLAVYTIIAYSKK